MTDLVMAPEQAMALKNEALSLPSIDLDWCQIGELEMLLNGAYAPLRGYMSREDYECVLERLCLLDGTAWPLPQTLRLNEKHASAIQAGSRVALRDGEGFLLAVLTVSGKWLSDPVRDQALLENSPLTQGVELEAGIWHLAGTVEGVSLPMHHDFSTLRLAPAELRAQFAERGWGKVVGWLANQPMHRAQFDFCQKTVMAEQANLLLLPFGGGDLTVRADYFTLLRTFQKVLPRFPAQATRLAMLPIRAARASMREKLMRVLLARNYGCTHVILGGEHEPIGETRRGEDLVQNSFDLKAEAHKLGVTVIAFPRLQYVAERAEFHPASEISVHDQAHMLSGEEFARRMRLGQEIPAWYAFPEVIAEMHRAHPPRERLGFAVFFTGLSGAGKSTLARALASRLMERGGRPVTLLDGDIVRRHLSSELGFSREHRDINVRRIGFVASEITKNRGVAICAPIAPYRQTRRDVRSMVEAVGGFIEVHVSTPIETCESRDRKGLYAKARAGLIPEFTGVSDPYEVPEKPEVVLDTTALTVDEAVDRILLKLAQDGYLKP